MSTVKLKTIMPQSTVPEKLRNKKGLRETTGISRERGNRHDFAGGWWEKEKSYGEEWERDNTKTLYCIWGHFGLKYKHTGLIFDYYTVWLMLLGGLLFYEGKGMDLGEKGNKQDGKEARRRGGRGNYSGI